MKEVQSKLLAIYYAIYAVFIIGLVLAHIYPLWFGIISPDVSLIISYVVVGTLLVCVPLSVGLNTFKLKKQVDLDYYFKWNAIPMLILAIPGIVAFIGYASIYKFSETGEFQHDRSCLFAYLIVFVALILLKPTKPKIEKYFQAETDSSLKAE
ncbi:MAG: hypothetical protein II455_05465 [Paludibacteraceae bacterium]|nr:hypothetical protein [Paludibacteraceae bacterium]